MQTADRTEICIICFLVRKSLSGYEGCLRQRRNASSGHLGRRNIQDQHLQGAGGRPSDVADDESRRRSPSRSIGPWRAEQSGLRLPSGALRALECRTSGEQSLPWGSFGENFTIERMLETDVYIGDRYRLGGAIVRVTTPRLPCFKLAAKFRSDDIIERFLDTGRCGFYFSVAEEGEVGAGDAFELLEREKSTLSIATVNSELYSAKSPDRETLEQPLHVKTLPESWRERFRARLGTKRLTRDRCKSSLKGTRPLL